MGGGSDETWDPDATVTPDAIDRAVVTTEPQLLVGRYRLGALIGRGGSGQVHAAHDTVMDEAVAIKFVRTLGAGSVRQLRRELTALRVLAVPGVVRLRDDGEDLGQTFLVMELLPGGTFDELAGSGAWSEWSEHARGLLETLARVHFAGVIHLDLKPANVLLTADRVPVVTDFGLARGRSVEDPGAAHLEGTPRYMAPEQRLGAPCDARTDLYAVGGMFWEMLTGHGLPPPEEDRSLDGVDAPTHVRDLVSRMLSQDPDDRPASAVDVLEGLFGESPAVMGPADLGLPAVATAEQLRGLFDEPQPSFLGLAEDAADELHARTGGAEGQVYRELDRWVRAGRVWWNEERVHIERPAIEQLRWERDPERLRIAGLVDDPNALVDAALAFAREQHDQGSFGRALAILEATLVVARDVGRAAEVAEQIVVSAVFSMAHLDRALHHATREGARDAGQLVRAAIVRGDGRWDQVLALVDSISKNTSDRLRSASIGLRSLALGYLNPEEHVKWLGEDTTRAKSNLDSWHTSWGRHLYAAGQYGQAARHHVLAGDAANGPAVMAYTLMNAATAALEIPDLDWAIALAGEAAFVLDQCRMPTVRASAYWLGRAARYRRGDRLAPAGNWVDATERVSLRTAADLSITEAAIAWRGGWPDAVGLATRARSLYERCGAGAGATLAASLEAAVSKADAVAVVDRAWNLPLPELTIQAFALLALAGNSGLEWRGILNPLEESRPVESWGNRLDILSIQEAVAILTAQCPTDVLLWG